MTMGFDWRRKQTQGRNRGSQTPGRTKVLSCHASPLERYFAKRNRSYKHIGYEDWWPYVKTGNSRIRMVK
uniref:Uncharacterized protein n=1 Tax=viral metagenome TaxID=1070528 RepID=A0A6H1ZAT5_9ZZZZ